MLQKEEREEKLRLDYCGHCHEPIGSVEYEEIYINKLNYRIHKSCINEFKKSDSELFNEWKLSEEKIAALRKKILCKKRRPK